MTDTSFDVYLTGATDASPSGHMRIAGTIATRYRLPAPVVAQVFAEGGSCRVAERLSRTEAQALIDTLATLGATARLVTAGTPLGAKPAAVEAQIPAARVQPSVAPQSARVDPPSLDLERTIGDTVRCPIHGLAYDRSRASGCVRCLSPARAQARALAERPGVVGPMRLRDSPVRLAFWGLALALFLGFLPAAYYGRWSSRGELETLRAQQAELSAQPATRDSLARFDELDARVHAGFVRSAGWTLLIWIVVAGLTGGAWAKLTAPKPEE